MLAKWLLVDSEILILDEPTRGIDVGAREEIYQIINELAQEGKTVIVVILGFNRDIKHLPANHRDARWRDQRRVVKYGADRRRKCNEICDQC